MTESVSGKCAGRPGRENPVRRAFWRFRNRPYEWSREGRVPFIRTRDVHYGTEAHTPRDYRRQGLDLSRRGFNRRRRAAEGDDGRLIRRIDRYLKIF